MKRVNTNLSKRSRIEGRKAIFQRARGPGEKRIGEKKIFAKKNICLRRIDAEIYKSKVRGEIR